MLLDTQYFYRWHGFLSFIDIHGPEDMPDMLGEI